ncbi:MAG: KdsC family phosphatase [Desulfonatronovibrio sp.]
MDQDILPVAAEIKMLIIDVDGVLTDGGLYYDAEGRIMKRFNVQDGLGIKLAQAAGLKLAVISGLSSPAVEFRIMELGITDYFQGHKDKLPLIEKLAAENNTALKQIAYLGDDWVDASAMLSVGLPMAVANAQQEILRIAKWISQASGGHGAVREAIMYILRAQNKIDQQWRKWAYAK